MYEIEQTLKEKNMLEDFAPVILQLLIENRAPAKMEDIVALSGYDKADVIKTLGSLCDLDLLRKEKGTVTMYHLVQEVKAIHLAKAAQVGIDLSAFDNFFKIDKKEKKLALELATKVEKIKQLEVNKRKPLIQKRSYLLNSKNDDVYENLSLLYEASNMALYEYLEKMAEKDEYLKLLLAMHEQSESSLQNYSTNLN